MIYRMIRYLKGYVRIRVYGDSIERFINLCCYQKLLLWNLISSNQYYEMNISRSEFKKLRSIVRKTHTHVTIVQRKGLPFHMHHYRKRPLLFFGFLLCCSLIYLYSNTIWSIDFKGNQHLTTEVLLNYLESHEIHSGIKKTDVKCESIVQMIRKDFDDVVWVSASIDGSKLFIHLKENTEVEPEQKEEVSSPKDLVATKAGIITDIITRAGVPMVHIGDTVKEGDLLVSGRVEVRNDSDEVVSYQYQSSDSDIYAATEYEYYDSISTKHIQKKYAKKQQRIWYITLFDIKIASRQLSKQTNQEIHTTESHLRIGSSLSLPIKVGEISYVSYDEIEEKYTQKEQQSLLSAKFNQFCKDLVKKGVQITSNSVKIHIGVSDSVASGKIYTVEQIDTAIDTEILDLNTERIQTE